jgi:UDP-N-acetylmuramoyl-tripeptide--D-alanyl-D-alanine ligase
MGEMAKVVADGALAAGMSHAQVAISGTHEEIVEAILADLQQADAILVKGSRGMNMDRIATGLRQHLTGGDDHGRDA